MKLRVHHLLCIPLFIGKGYSKEFVDNMWTIVYKIKKNTNLELQVVPDHICGGCPNYLEETFQCKLDKNHVKTKDMALVQELSIDIKKSYSAKDIFKVVQKKMTEEIFENSCRMCSWYKQGLCNYEKYKSALNDFIDDIV